MLDPLIPGVLPPDRVKLPTTLDEATAMLLVASLWLREHAPNKVYHPPAPRVVQQAMEALYRLHHELTPKFGSISPSVQADLDAVRAYIQLTGQLRP